MAKLQRSAEETARRATELGWARHVASAAAKYASAEELAREMQQRVEQRREQVQPPPGPGGLTGTGAWKAKLGSADPELVALERRCFQAQLEQENCRLRLETLQYHRETRSRTFSFGMPMANRWRLVSLGSHTMRRRARGNTTSRPTSTALTEQILGKDKSAKASVRKTNRNCGVTS